MDETSRPDRADGTAHPHPHTVTTPGERRWAFRILFGALTVIGMGQTVIFAILPPLSRKLELGEFQVASIFMTSAVMWLFTSPFWGQKSDMWGRKPVMLLGLAGYVVSMTLLGGLLESARAGWITAAVLVPALIAARTIYGTLGSGVFSASHAYVADRTTAQERTAKLASIGAAFITGTTLGPGLVWLLSPLGLLSPIYAVVIFGLVTLLTIWLFVPERTGPKPHAPPPRVRFLDKRIAPLVIVAIVMSSAQAIPIQTVTFFLMDALLMEPTRAAQMGGLALTATSVAMLLGQLVILPRLTWSVNAVMRFGTIFWVIGTVIFIWPGGGYPAVLVGIMLMGFGAALARAGIVGATSLAVTPGEQGGVAGLMSATGGAGFIVAPLIAFPVYKLWPPAPYVASLVLLVGCLVWLYGTQRSEEVRT